MEIQLAQQIHSSRKHSTYGRLAFAQDERDFTTTQIVTKAQAQHFLLLHRQMLKQIVYLARLILPECHPFRVVRLVFTDRLLRLFQRWITSHIGLTERVHDLVARHTPEPGSLFCFAKMREFCLCQSYGEGFDQNILRIFPQWRVQPQESEERLCMAFK